MGEDHQNTFNESQTSYKNNQIEAELKLTIINLYYS